MFLRILKNSMCNSIGHKISNNSFETRTKKLENQYDFFFLLTWTIFNARHNCKRFESNWLIIHGVIARRAPLERR